MKYLILTLFFLAFANTNTCNNKSSKIAKNEEAKIQAVQKNKFFITILNGKDVSQEKLHITIDEERNSISGYSGCNTFSCKYTIEQDTISLSFPIASKMHCPKKVDLEQDFFKALSEVKTKVVEKDSLLLKNNKGTVLFSGVKSNQ